LRGSWNGEVSLDLDLERTEQRILSIHRVSDAMADEVGFILIFKLPPKADGTKSANTDSLMFDSSTGMYSATTFESLIPVRTEITFRKNLRAFILVISTLVDTNTNVAGAEELIGEIQYLLARSIDKVIRGCDMATHMGNYGFAVLINYINDVEEVKDIMSNIKNTISKSFRLQDQDFSVKVKIGCTELAINGESAMQLFIRAQESME
jgi:predicted signal transduction protein with EAL and GGDEF domain